MVPNKHSPKKCVHKSVVRHRRRTEKGGDQVLVKTKKHDKPAASIAYSHDHK